MLQAHLPESPTRREFADPLVQEQQAEHKKPTFYTQDSTAMMFSRSPRQPAHSRSVSAPTFYPQQSHPTHIRSVSSSSTASAFSVQTSASPYSTAPSSRGTSRPASEQYGPGTFAPPFAAIAPPTPSPKLEISFNNLPERPKAIKQPMNELQRQRPQLSPSAQKWTPRSPIGLSLAFPTSGAFGSSGAPDIQPTPQTHTVKEWYQRRASETASSIGSPLNSPQGSHFNRRASQTPKTEGPVGEEVYVLTLATSPELSLKMQEVKGKYFPNHRDKVGAHVTLFHALPSSHLAAVETRLQELTSRLSPIKARTGEVIRMKKGAAVALSKAADLEIKKVHEGLKQEWYAWLSEQDKASFRGHWTIVNNVDNGYVVERAVQELERWEGAEGTMHGVVLWKFREDGTLGFWRRFEFLGEERR